MLQNNLGVKHKEIAQVVKFTRLREPLYVMITLPFQITGLSCILDTHL
jgi:hypothetical protein